VTAIGVLTWDTTDDRWRADRKHGLGGSDVSAVLGFSRYRTPWQVWAEKTGRRTWQDDTSVPAELGLELEPWLMGKAAQMLKVPVVRTQWRTYAHAEHSWRRVSPDGITVEDTPRLVECKTAGLASGYGTPEGWDNGRTPLDYEFQGRWAMHVMDCDLIEFVGLVAGMGVIHRTIHRNLATETSMVRQVTDWYVRHIVGDVEPPLGAADNAVLTQLYPEVLAETVDLSDTDAMEHYHRYRAAQSEESAAKKEKEAAGASIKALMGGAEVATVEDHAIATWSPTKGKVDWPAMVADLAAEHGFIPPDPETYRKPPTRTLRLKEIR
jgi:putative phage-type endonuclease